MKRRIEMKKLMAIILTLAMVMSLCVVPASAADGKVTITITPDKTSVDTATGDAVVTYTVKAKVNDPTLKVGALTITLEPSAGLTLADKTKANDSSFYYKTEATKYIYNEETNPDGIFTNFSYAKDTKTFVAAGATSTRNLNSSTGEVVLMTIMGKIAQGTTGSVTLKTTQHSYGDTMAEASHDCDVTPASVTITKAPIASVSASVKTPEAGKALDTTVDIGGATGYTAAVEWYKGNAATGSTVSGKAEANTKYTAKITLTAGSGESFADSVTIPTDYTKDSSSTSSKLVLTRTFDETGSLPKATVTAPTAKPDLKYTGSNQALLSYRGTATNGTMQYSLNGTDWTETDPTGKDAKTYTVYYKAKGNSGYSDSDVASIQVTIDPKEISGVTIGTITDQPYTDGAITLDPEVKDGTTVLGKDTDYTVSCTHTYVGTNTGKLTITGKGNYTGTKDANFNIVAADQKPIFTTPVNLATGGARLDLRTLVSGAKGDNMTFAIASGTAAQLNGYELTSTGVPGDVTIKVSITAKDVNNDGKNEYNEYNKSDAITVKVVNKTPDTDTMTVTQGSITYGDAVSPSVANKPADAGEVSYTYVGRDGTTYSSSATAPKNVGKYKVTAKCESSTVIYTATATFEIQPKSISDVTVTLDKTSLKYNGSAQTVNVTGVGTLTAADYDVTSGTSGKDVGNYDVIVTGQGNYTDTATATWWITAKEVTVTGITATNRAYEKDNLEVALADGTLNGVFTGDTVTIDLTNAKGTMTDANAGNGKAVTVTGVALGGADKGNYKLKAQPTGVTVDITKKTAPTLEDITVSQKYNVTTEQSKDIGTAGMPEDAGTLTYAKGTASPTGTVTVTSWNVDTNGKVTYKLSNGAVDDTVTLPVTIKSTNYVDATVNVVITLIKGSSGGYYYAPTTAVVPDMPMLYRGCTGDAVKTLQDKLNALGYNSGSVDGIFGAKTYAAVTAFQKANSLGVDGIVGKLTWGKIYGVSPAMPVETTTVVGRPMVSYGSRGDAVRKLQELLNALGYDCGSVDGIFGSKTKAAVLAFQKANGLGVDGIVGPLTWAKLG